MPVQTATDCVLFQERLSKSAVAIIKQDLASADGGGFRPKDVDGRISLTVVMSDVRRVRRITRDGDASHDPVHGGEQLSVFHGHYDTYCFVPRFGSSAFSNETEPYPCTAMLRPRNVLD